MTEFIAVTLVLLGIVAIIVSLAIFSWLGALAGAYKVIWPILGFVLFSWLGFIALVVDWSMIFDGVYIKYEFELFQNIANWYNSKELFQSEWARAFTALYIIGAIAIFTASGLCIDHAEKKEA